jgi:hypothetical protein
VDLYHQLAIIGGERDSIRAYLETQQAELLQTCDTYFLIDAIQSAKARCHRALSDQQNESDGAARP